MEIPPEENIFKNVNGWNLPDLHKNSPFMHFPFFKVDFYNKIRTISCGFRDLKAVSEEKEGV